MQTAALFMGQWWDTAGQTCKDNHRNQDLITDNAAMEAEIAARSANLAAAAQKF